MDLLAEIELERLHLRLEGDVLLLQVDHVLDLLGMVLVTQ